MAKKMLLLFIIMSLCGYAAAFRLVVYQSTTSNSNTFPYEIKFVNTKTGLQITYIVEKGKNNKRNIFEIDNLNVKYINNYEITFTALTNGIKNKGKHKLTVNLGEMVEKFVWVNGSQFLSNCSYPYRGVELNLLAYDSHDLDCCEKLTEHALGWHLCKNYSRCGC